MRAMLKGRASGDTNHGGGHNAWTSWHVHRFWRVVPLQLELVVRRLKYYQCIARFPGDHTQVLAALFCKCLGEVEQQIDEEGRLTIHACKHLQQLRDDVAAIAGIDQYQEWHEDLGGRMLLLFNDNIFKDEFDEMDFNVLRAKYFTVEIPYNYVNTSVLQQPLQLTQQQ